MAIMAYVMISGKPPFQDDTPFTMMHMHVYEHPDYLILRRDDLPVGLDRAIRTALAKEPKDRFASAGAFIVALKNAASRPLVTEDATVIDEPATPAPNATAAGAASTPP